MRYSDRTVLACVALVATMLLSNHTFAASMTVAGVNFSTGASFQVGEIYQDEVSNPGDILRGYGRVDTINGSANFCAAGPGSCELTVAYNDYQLNEVNGPSAGFMGGNVEIYADTSPDFSANSRASANDGALFLSATGHMFLDRLSGRRGTLLAQVSSSNASGSGVGRLDVTGGAASTYFDTNTDNDFLGGSSDFLINASFAPCYAGATADLCGSANLHGAAQAAMVSEPGQLGLLTLGLIGLCVVSTRRRNRR